MSPKCVPDQSDFVKAKPNSWQGELEAETNVHIEFIAEIA